jgi:hypothetical protein
MVRLLALALAGVALLACAVPIRTSSGGAAPATQESLGLGLDERREIR